MKQQRFGIIMHRIGYLPCAVWRTEVVFPLPRTLCQGRIASFTLLTQI
jgi:hypothetical protein